MKRIATAATGKRARIILDVPPEIRKKVRIAAAYKDTSIRNYILDAIRRRLEEEPLPEKEILALNDRADPVLGALWDNPKDARYDAL